MRRHVACGRLVRVTVEAHDMTTDSATVWVCSVCGYEHTGPTPPEACPVCGATPDLFERQDAESESDGESAKSAGPSSEYLAEWAREKDDFEQSFARIRNLAVTGVSEVSPMRTQRSFPSWEAVLFKGAQLHRLPVNEDEAVNTRTVIGRAADRPLELEIPFYVSHMSFGALSKDL